MTANKHYVVNRDPLEQTELVHLPLGAVRPRGWLKDQLRVQANGLTGHLDEFWIHDSWWKGGSGENNAGSPSKIHLAPNYLEGLVPLAYLLDDKRLIDKVTGYMEFVLASGRPDGYFGPVQGEDSDCRLLGRARVLRALPDYYEATGDERVLTLCHDYLTRYPITDQPEEWLGDCTFKENLVCAYWLYNQTGRPEILDAATRIGSRPFPNGQWTEAFLEGRMAVEHGYAIAHGIKYPGLRWQQSRDERHREAAFRAIEWLDEHHGQAGGRFAAHEWLPKADGTKPTHGTELCHVVEYMFSLEKLLEIFGEVSLADRIEMLAFNALPGTCSADFWAHQYDQQANQVLVNVAKHGFDNGDWANVFGLEPNYTCCLANMHQGFPRYVRHMWMATHDQGLAAVVHGPCRVTAKVADGADVTITEQTEYPFDGTIRFEVRTARPVRFPLYVRVPGWADGAAVTVNGDPAEGVEAGTLFKIERDWADGDGVVLSLPMPVRTETRHNGAVSLLRGPLVFSLRMPGEYRDISTERDWRGPFPAYDWEIRPREPWNYALQVDREAPGPDVEVMRNPLTEVPFAGRGEPVFRNRGTDDEPEYERVEWPDDAPVVLRVRARRVPEWGMHPEFANADDTPNSPVKSDEPDEVVDLVPYASTRLRITEFPTVDPC